MRLRISFLFILTFCSICRAEEVPVKIGMGVDYVWLNFGLRPAWNENSCFLPQYSALVTYGPDKTVESIVLSPLSASSGKGQTLRGIGVGEDKKDVLRKLSKPTKELPKDKSQAFDVYLSVWLLKNDQLLEVGFWKTDQASPEKHAKDSVAYVTLRKSHL